MQLDTSITNISNGLPLILSIKVWHCQWPNWENLLRELFSDAANIQDIMTESHNFETYARLCTGEYLIIKAYFLHTHFSHIPDSINTQLHAV
jgi:hypothetical protein